MLSHFPSFQRAAALPWQSRLACYIALVLVLAGVAASGWIMREPMLRGAANLWIVSDPIGHADAIVVLGGGLDTRPFVAAELWRKGLADKILISQGPAEQADSMGRLSPHGEPTHEKLLKLGVPIGAIETFGTENRSTRDEAVALRGWADRNAASAFIIPTEIFPARRVRWIFRREFLGAPVRVAVTALSPPGYNHTNWWKTENGQIAFRTELLKYIFYRLKY
jgi:uncharacterized SAM-binding protein YcdF (DUF218 family)